LDPEGDLNEMRFWPFTRKKANVVDTSTAAGLPLFLLVERKEPFVYVSKDEILYDWCPTAKNTSEEKRAILRMATIGYQLVVFLHLIELKFGSEIARIIREHLLIAADRVPDLQIRDMLIAMEQSVQRALRVELQNGENLEPYVAVSALWFTSGSPYYVSPERRQEQFDANVHLPNDRLDQALATLLINAKNDALRVFGPAVDFLELKEETIGGLKRGRGAQSPLTQTSIELPWSDSPGCWEQCLQTRYGNPLFVPERRIVTAPEVEAARRRDNEERENFRTAMMDVLTQVTSADHVMGYEEADSFRQRIEDLLQRAAAIGAEKERQQLWSLYKAHTADIENSIQTWQHRKDEALQAARDAHQIAEERLIQFSGFVAQFMRKDSPISQAELIPYVLSQDPSTIIRFMLAVSDEHKKGLCDWAKALVAKAEKEGFQVPEVQEKLRALGCATDAFTQTNS
jgi:hypothetical protein